LIEEPGRGARRAEIVPEAVPSLKEGAETF